VWACGEGTATRADDLERCWHVRGDAQPELATPGRVHRSSSEGLLAPACRHYVETYLQHEGIWDQYPGPGWEHDYDYDHETRPDDPQ
jgi:hypothetical protein